MIQALRPSLWWLWVQDDKKFVVPQAVLDIPGVVWREPDPGYQLWRCEIPFTAWSETAIGVWLAKLDISVPVMPVLDDVLTSLELWPTWQSLFQHQRVGVRFLIRHPHAVLGDQMGLGKQQPVETPVLTPSGWQPIGDLRVGDHVLGSDGKAKVVVGVYPQGVKPTYRVTFSDHSSTLAGAEHLWTVTVGRNGRALLLTTEQLRTRPKLTLQWSRGTRRETVRDLAKAVLYLPTLSAPAEFVATTLPIPAYLLGQLIANGSMAYSTPKLVVSKHDWPTIKKRLLADGVVLGGESAYANVIHSTYPGLLPRIRALGLNKLSATKRIPQSYLRASIADRVALLHGLMDGDGSCSATRSKLTYHTISAGLADDVRELVECLGGIASVRSYDRSQENKPREYHVRLRLPQSIAPFTVARKLDRYKPGRLARPCRTVTTVEYVGEQASVCIAVDAEDALYVTEHAILTHNSRVAGFAGELLRKSYSRDRGFWHPALITAPKALEEVWIRELAACGITNVFVCRGMKPTMIPADVDWIFCHYDILKAWWSHIAIRRPCVAVLDEAHMVKNSRSRRGAAVALAVSSAPYRFILTGTPILNRVEEFWFLLTLATGQWTWGKPSDFRIRYCGAQTTQYGLKDGVEATNVDELKQRLACCYIRRDVESAGLQLPPLTRQLIHVELDQEQMADYQEILEHIPMEELIQAVLHRRASKQTLGYIGRLRKLTSRAKFDTTVQLAKNVLEQDESVIIFCWERKMCERLFGKLYDAGFGKIHVVHGGMTHKVRNEVVDEFQSMGGAIIATIDSLGVGVTLHKARHVIMHDLDWVPAKMLQAEKRAHRIGQAWPVTSYWPVASNTIDDIIARAFDRKGQPILDVTGDEAPNELADLLPREELYAGLQRTLDWARRIG